MVITTRTSCTLYLLGADGVKRMTGYLLNSRKKPLWHSKNSKYSYDFRFYFTSSKIIKAHEKTASKVNDFADPSKAEQTQTGLKLFESTNNIGFNESSTLIVNK